MKIKRITGHFGNMRGRTFTFTDGLNICQMENEMGKTTLCALIRVMLYGLQTGRRDTRKNLSDKTRYAPLDNHAMEGVMEIQTGGRDIVIARTTGKGGPMQEFDAYDRETGRKCTGLTAKETGNLLLGIGEEGFLASCMIDGTDLSLSSKELGDKMASMSSTGDVGSVYSQAAERLRRYQLDLNSGNGAGEEPRLLEALNENRKKTREVQELAEQLAELQQQISRQTEEEKKLLAQKAEVDQALSQDIYVQEDRLMALEREIIEKIEEIEKQIPDAQKMKAADDAMFAYEGALKLDKKRRERLAEADLEFERKRKALMEKREEEDDRLYRESTPKVRWWALILAAFFGIAAFGLYVMLPTLFYVPLVFLVVTAVLLLVAIAGRNPMPQGDDRSRLEREMEKLDKEKQEIDAEQKQGGSILQESYDQLLKAGRQLRPDATDFESVVQAIRDCGSAQARLIHENKLLEEIQEQLKTAKTDEKGKQLRQKQEALAQTLERVQLEKRALTEQAARLEGRRMAIGDEKSLKEEKANILDELQDVKRNQEAIQYARQLLEDENQKRTEEVSPEICSAAAEYLSAITGERYTQVQLNQNFTGACGSGDGKLLDPKRLSSGARDQLYLALRLAVCKVLLKGKEPAPLILDDPFITFDEERQRRALFLLKQIAKERQVILLLSKSIPE